MCVCGWEVEFYSHIYIQPHLFVFQPAPQAEASAVIIPCPSTEKL